MTEQKLILNPISLSGLSTGQRKIKFISAIQQIEHAINESHEFEAWFLKQSFTQLYNRKELTNTEHLKILRQQINFNYSVIKRSWWKRFSSVIGYQTEITRTKGIDVFTYSDSFDNMSVAGLAGHLCHEIVCHGSGYSHDFNWSRERDLSLPYAVGNKIEELTQKRIAEI